MRNPAPGPGDVPYRAHHINSIWLSRWTTPAVSFLLISSLIFIMFPTFDLAVTRFFANGNSFPWSENPILLAVRDANRRAMIYLLILMIVMIVLYAVKPQKFKFFQPHKAFFVILTFLIGPFLIVQFLKNFFARARPRSLHEFGGSADFTPVWQYAVQCSRNCSFPSGEAATAAATLSVIILIPVKWRPIAVAVITPILLLASFNRVIFGAHFLSDVAIAWGLMCCLMIWLWRRISQNAQNIDYLIENLGRTASK
ncbi:phosphatase PAP2 family protein [Brucella grignonensis]|uniref:PAP2 superfamily protein n=1 Tax=Brucella grignonensis TaxID=94627 RepID=A0A256EZK1_9HYPH|nr:phosphatase PAP2 family protein [Brucella grignonensis]OYR07943.1 PAP2 superfamily protein [Brucella grignonensis]